MTRIIRFDPILQTQLPLPLARLYLLAFHAREERDRHDHSLHLAEAALKLLASALVGRYRACGGRSERVDAALRQLTMPTLGHWRDLLRETLYFLGKGCDSRSWSGEVLQFLESAEAASGAGEALSTLADLAGFSGRPWTGSPLLGFLDFLPSYRNAMSTAHAGIKSDRGCYEKATSALLELLRMLLEGGAVLAGAKLVLVEDVKLERDGELTMFAVDLSGPSAVRRPEPDRGDVAGGLLPGRVYLETRAGEHISLHPLLYFRSAGDQEQVFFLNRARGKTGGMQFLCYSTGDLHVPGNGPCDAALARDVEEFLRWIESAGPARRTAPFEPSPRRALLDGGSGNGQDGHGSTDMCQGVRLIPLMLQQDIVYMIVVSPGIGVYDQGISAGTSIEARDPGQIAVPQPE